MRTQVISIMIQYEERDRANNNNNNIHTSNSPR